ncbi:MAG: hypothetical protein MI920_01205 [Kiloniellales bacterium]|nr:hypothetical protein [Kiloniellales bacterium]
MKPGDEFTCYAVGYDEIVIRRKRLDVSDLVGILRVPDKRASVEAVTESARNEAIARAKRRSRRR